MADNGVTLEEIYTLLQEVQQDKRISPEVKERSLELLRVAMKMWVLEHDKDQILKDIHHNYGREQAAIVYELYKITESMKDISSMLARHRISELREMGEIFEHYPMVASAQNDPVLARRAIKLANIPMDLLVLIMQKLESSKDGLTLDSVLKEITPSGLKRWIKNLDYEAQWKAENDQRDNPN